MLRDELEIILGRMLGGEDLTPAIFLLMKGSASHTQLIADALQRGGVSDGCVNLSGPTGTEVDGGFDIKQWLANRAKPVTIRRYAGDSLQAKNG